MTTTVKAQEAREGRSARRAVGTVVLAGIVLLISLWVPPDARATVYRWTDERGQVHVTDNPNDLPPRYRSQPPPAAAPPPPGARPDALRRSLEQWRNALRSPSAQARAEAASQGHVFGPPAVPALAQAVTDPSTDVRIAAIGSLAAIGPAAKSAAPPLAAALRDPDVNVRMWAAAALLRTGTHVKEALKVWVAELDNKALQDPGSRMVVGMFGVAPETVPALIEAWRGGDRRVREATVQLLGFVGFVKPPNREAVTALIQALKGSDSRMRAAAAQSLGVALAVGQPTPSPEAITALMQALKDQAPEVRKRAAQSLSWAGPGAVWAIPTLMEALRSPYGDVRGAVPLVLGRVAPGSPELMSALLLGLQDTDPDVQTHVADLVGLKHHAARELAPALLKGTRSPDPKVRIAMLKALGVVSRTQPSPEVIAAATRALKDPVLEVQDAALMSLDLISCGGTCVGSGVATAVPALIEAFKSHDAARRRRVLAVLVKIAPDSRQVMSTVMLGLRDSDAQVQQHAAAFAPLLRGPAAGEVIPALLEGAKSPDARVRTEMLRALGRVGRCKGRLCNSTDTTIPASREVAVALTEGLRDPDVSVRVVAANSLGAAGAEAVVAVPLLIQALADPDRNIRGAAVKALGGLGPAAKSALPSLKELERKEPGLQREIAESIRKIERR